MAPWTHNSQTFCKLAEAFNIKPSELLNMIEKELPENWSFCD